MNEGISSRSGYLLLGWSPRKTYQDYLVAVLSVEKAQGFVYGDITVGEYEEYKFGHTMEGNFFLAEATKSLYKLYQVWINGGLEKDIEISYLPKSRRYDVSEDQYKAVIHGTGSL